MNRWSLVTNVSASITLVVRLDIDEAVVSYHKI